ncbi:MAG: AraC family transcriptional regulator [Spirochaetales bacterium]|nr:AraC family transcriptional regulator [Spirochaetales bacterium]
MVPGEIFDLVFLSAGAVFNLVWAAGTYSERTLERRARHRLAALLLVSSLWLAFGALHFSGLDRLIGDRLLLALPPLFLVGPLLYAFLREAVAPDDAHFRPASPAHLLAPVCAFALVLAQLEGGPVPAAFAPGLRALLNAGPKLSAVVYGLAFLLRHRFVIFLPSALPLTVRRGLFALMISVLAAIGLGLVGFATGQNILVRLSAHCLPLLTYALFLFSRRFPNLLRLVERSAARVRYERSRLVSVDVDALANRLLALMNDEKLFADEDINLSRLSEYLNVRVHQLSELLNERFGKNFNTFINEFRVNEARRMLIEEPDRSVLSVGFASGFNSKSAFHRAFQAQTGVTPRQYRENYSFRSSRQS